LTHPLEHWISFEPNKQNKSENDKIRLGQSEILHSSNKLAKNVKLQKSLSLLDWKYGG